MENQIKLTDSIDVVKSDFVSYFEKLKLIEIPTKAESIETIQTQLKSIERKIEIDLIDDAKQIHSINCFKNEPISSSI